MPAIPGHDSGVEESTWDGNAAMGRCSTAACYRAICAWWTGENPDQRSSYSFPHHKQAGGPANLPAVRNALARLPGSNVPADERSGVEAHLRRHLRAGQSESSQPPPRDGLYRAMFPADLELRDTADGDGTVGAPTMVGHFARFNEWTEIDSVFEGRFLERIAPGAFRKTFSENRTDMRVLFQHGRDPNLGMKVLGPVEEVREDEKGAWFEVPLLDTEYVRELLPGLRAGLYGSSFRFQVMREQLEQKPKRSDANPEGLPERTLQEIRLYEFGPVTFPAYAGATAGIRSLTDEFMVGRLVEDPDRLREITEYIDAAPEPSGATTQRDEQEPAPEPSGATTQAAHPPSEKEPVMEEEQVRWTLEERRRRIEEIEERQRELDREFSGYSLDEAAQLEWDKLAAEHDTHMKAIADQKARDSYMQSQRDRGEVEEEQVADRGNGNGGWRAPADRVPQGGKLGIPSDLYDLPSYRRMNDSERFVPALRTGARMILERATFQIGRESREDIHQHIEALLMGPDLERGDLARRIIATGSETYVRAFGKAWAGEGLTQAEQRALSTTTTAGGFAVPYTLDPTVILTSNGSVNPFRQIARIEQITTTVWQGVSSAGVTAGYSAEATESGDDAPTIAQPSAQPEMCDVFIPFSFEIGMDWAGLQSEMARLVADAKDDVEADKFVTGVGHAGNEPEGLHTGATAVVSTAAATTFAAADVYNLEAQLPPRFRPRASIVGNRVTYNRVRQFDTQGGAQLWIRIGDGLRNQRTGALGEALLGYPTYEASSMSTALTSAASILTIGDFSHFLIVDRIGMQAELLPNLLGATRRPTKQRGLLFWWRNTSDVLAWQAFRTMKVT